MTAVRERLKDLNTKAYYLLVALSFLCKGTPTVLLKFAIGLTALVAAVPMQDYIKDDKSPWLSRIQIVKVVALASAFLFTLVWLIVVR